MRIPRRMSIRISNLFLLRVEVAYILFGRLCADGLLQECRDLCESWRIQANGPTTGARTFNKRRRATNGITNEAGTKRLLDIRVHRTEVSTKVGVFLEELENGETITANRRAVFIKVDTNFWGALNRINPAIEAIRSKA